MRFYCLLAIAFTTAACEYRVHVGSDSSGGGGGGYSGDPRPPADAPVDPSCDAKIDRWKELLVVDPSVLASDEARNDQAGAAFSFRTRMEELAGHPDDESTARFTASWLASWSTVTQVGVTAAPVTPRRGVRDVILTPWRTLATGGAPCDDTTVPSMRDAPFRLIAIVHRPDLTPSACTVGGELRFVYTASDPRTGAALAMNAIVEVPYPSTRSALGWAQAWHDLARKPFGREYTAGLASLVREVMSSADPARTRLRTSEIAFGEAQRLPWEMRQFAIETKDGTRALVPSLLSLTPRDGLDGAPVLDSWLTNREPRLRRGIVDELPIALAAGATSMPDPSLRWGLTARIDEQARAAFSAATCNGCHAGERPADELAFRHLAPADATSCYDGASIAGGTRISRFLNDPTGGPDELTRREEAMRSILCAMPCTPVQSPDAPDSPDAPYAPTDYAACR